MSYSLIDLSENAQDNRYPITNDFGLLYQQFSPHFNYAQFQSLKVGMRYKKVIEILGEGTEVLRQNIGDIEKAEYIWRNSNGSNIRAVFNDDELVNKVQSRLQ